MARYVAGRLLAAVPVLVGVLLVVFVILRLIPGDPVQLLFYSQAGNVGGVTGTGVISQEVVEDLRAAYNLDKPIPAQFVLYVADVVRGDFGRSFRTQQRVTDIIAEQFPATLQLTLAGMGVALFIGLIAGVMSAVHHHTLVDYLSQFASVIGVSIPSFFLGLMMIYLFSIMLDWLPSIADEGPTALIMPAITLGVFSSAILARLTRSSMLDVLSRDYVRTARAKGLAERRVIWRHALQNALIPVITIVGLEFGSLLAGAVVVEIVFVRQGLGFTLVNAIIKRDYPIVQAVVMLAAVVYVLLNILVDVLYTYVDPRVRLSA